MNVADKRYFERWLNDLGDLNPEKLWRELVASNKLPAIDLFNAVSAVYSANIEGNPIDVNSYLASKFRGGKFKFRARDRKEIENLESAYRFAQTPAPNEKNFLVAHEMLAATLLRKSSLVKYRDQVVYVYSRAGLEYVALEPEHVPEAMQNMFAEVRKLRRASLRITEAFYHAALIHLVFVHIMHSWMATDGPRGCWRSGSSQASLDDKPARGVRGVLQRECCRVLPEHQAGTKFLYARL